MVFRRIPINSFATYFISPRNRSPDYWFLPPQCVNARGDLLVYLVMLSQMGRQILQIDELLVI
jgi:hypothetical protein